MIVDFHSISTCIALSAMLISTCGFAGAQTSKLDAPVSTTPTVRSEIKRGEDAAFECSLNAGTRYSAFVDCINAAIHFNLQANTKSEAFTLGLFVTALAHGRIINRGQEDPSWFPIWRKDVARIVKAYKLTETELCATFRMKCDLMKRLISDPKGTSD